MITTDWLYSDYLRPLPTQREPLPRPDVELGIRLTAAQSIGPVSRTYRSEEYVGGWPGRFADTALGCTHSASVVLREE